MASNRTSAQKSSFDELIANADAESLRALVHSLSDGDGNARRVCLDFLRRRVPMPSRQSRDAAGEAVLLVWSELTDYFAGDRWDRTGPAMAADDLAARLRAERIPAGTRRAIVDEAIEYIGRTDLEDALYEVIYAACYSNAELRDLAGRLEAVNHDSTLAHARQIYRGLDDREKYLELRSRKLVYGTDYYDLVMYHWESGDVNTAVAVARDGLKKGQGRMIDLQQFLAEQALQSGDRVTYLDLQYEQAINHLTVHTYQAFQRLCTGSEWQPYVPRFAEAFGRARSEDRLNFHLLLEQYDKAIAVLSSLQYPWSYDGSGVLKAAAALEERFPEQVLAFYRQGLGNVTATHQRSEYAHQAQVLLKMRRVWVDIMGQLAAWQKFARNIKAVNVRRPALQAEFSRLLPDWSTL